MEKKLKEILLVDDSKGLLSLSKRLIQEMCITEHISLALNGKLALDYLNTKNEEGEFPSPELIFLDINMPVLNGYQFLEKFKGSSIDYNCNIVMLTTSLDEIDKSKAKNYPCVKGFQPKPLTKDSVVEILEMIS